jgi:uncharacterized protein YjiS (DUF1127 family)
MSVQLLQESARTGRSLRDAVPPDMRTSALSACLRTVAAWIVRCRQRRALRELAEERRLLSDVGLTRREALDEAAKPFWRR